MPKVRLPRDLLRDARFFVLRWDHEAECMYLHVDDEDRSSHVLGSDLPAAVRCLVFCGVKPEIADRSIGVAREFRLAQVISDGRVIPLLPRDERSRNPFSEEMTRREPRMLHT